MPVARGGSAVLADHGPAFLAFAGSQFTQGAGVSKESLNPLPRDAQVAADLLEGQPLSAKLGDQAPAFLVSFPAAALPAHANPRVCT